MAETPCREACPLPERRPEKGSALPPGAREIVFSVSGMSCAACAARIEKVAGALERYSEHPLSKAIFAKAKGFGPYQAKEAKAVPGKGLLGEVEGKTATVGKFELIKELVARIPEESEMAAEKLARKGQTVVWVAHGEKVLGVISLADTLRPEAKEVVSALRGLGLKVFMLTGGNQATAQAIVEELALDSFWAQVLPEEKSHKIRELQDQGERVLMVGDGVNDAPALAQADCGVAVSSGTDIALEAADMALMRPDLRGAVTAVKLARATLRIIKQNLFWAFGYNVLAIPVAAGVFYPFFGWRLNPAIAAAAMAMSSVSVVVNALRLKRGKF